ncbi:uncharacterized protein BX664DRAFT_341550 [Halteromyces radiatus]|uniref:uncharacterized protein n=1 Tax=Halteromyces radiatus TaxID=101107 RepID=UPI00221FB201|nr:uncharacterized protein BX664DRAFT_341550 [Halteromyces radiatus]KAI8079827.1 hypothetical protein BX664DRAFT_341550 [Halteromyces radiatus]
MNFYNNSFFAFFLLVVLALFGTTEACYREDIACIVGNSGCLHWNTQWSCHPDPSARRHHTCGFWGTSECDGCCGP